MKIPTGALAVIALVFQGSIVAKADQTRNQVIEIAQKGILSQLAPKCGLRDTKWGSDLLQATASDVQAVLPAHDMFPTDAQMTQIESAEAIAGAAYIDGAELFAIYGETACSAFATQVALQDADESVKSFRDAGQPGSANASKPGWIPNAALEFAWKISRADLAEDCGLRSDDWTDNVYTATAKDYLSAAGINDPSIDGAERDRIPQVTSAVMDFNRTVALREYKKFEHKACSNKTNAMTIQNLNKIESLWKKNPNKWNGVNP